MSSSTTPQQSAESESQETPEAITFTVKAANDTKYPLTLAPTTSVADLKTKLTECAQVPADRQRLIYSGRVMKDEETLAFYKVQSGHTIHMVKTAASNTRSNASSSADNASSSPRIPANIAAGSGNNPLAGLTGARYAGLAPLPSANIFGPDGGMGPPPDSDQMYEIMQRPEFRSTMNEMLQNQQMLDYIINSNPALRSIPGVRELMQSPQFRQVMTDPEMLRQASAMQQLFGRRGFSPEASFPEPGRTDTTPAPANQSSTTPPQNTASPPTGGAANPFGGNPTTAPNPFAALFGFPGTGAPPPPLGNESSPLAPQIDWSRAAEILRQGSQPTAGTEATQGAAGTSPPLVNPFSLFGLSPLAVSPSPPVDNRPPEERYAEQLRQLNDMGFYDFDRNIQALRRSGGSVQGAVEYLLQG